LGLKTAVEERGLRARRSDGIRREPEGFLGLGFLDKLFVVVVGGTEVVVARATVFGRGAFPFVMGTRGRRERCYRGRALEWAWNGQIEGGLHGGRKCNKVTVSWRRV
jgi:hypothetical protein